MESRVTINTEIDISKHLAPKSETEVGETGAVVYLGIMSTIS